LLGVPKHSKSHDQRDSSEQPVCREKQRRDRIEDKAKLPFPMKGRDSSSMRNVITEEKIDDVDL
jgi:hypothetical protein